MYWYTLYTKPNSEYRVQTALHERGIDTYLPEIRATNKKNKHAREPFFPCYLFMNVNLEAIGYSKWQWVPGLRHIVEFGGQPIPLSENTINALRVKVDNMGDYGSQPLNHFHPGENVRITQGPLRDMIAIFDGPTTPGQRVQVLFTLLGSVKTVNIDPSHLEKFPSSSQVTVSKKPRRTRGRGRYIKGSTSRV